MPIVHPSRLSWTTYISHTLYCLLVIKIFSLILYFDSNFHMLYIKVEERKTFSEHSSCVLELNIL